MQGHGFDPWSGKTPYAIGQLSLCAIPTETSWATSEARVTRAWALQREEPPPREVFMAGRAFLRF